MFIVPLFPALFANRLLADRTSYMRGSAPLLPILCTQFSSELLSVTHPAITPRYHPKTHPHVGTLICHQTCSAFVLHSYFCFLCRYIHPMGREVRRREDMMHVLWIVRVMSPCLMFNGVLLARESLFKKISHKAFLWMQSD